jgi:hypothetical protein
MNEVPDRLLRETLLARTATSASADCLDADTVASWADEALTPRERLAVEAHAADCPRCRALLAALARATPPAAPRSWWRLPRGAWVAPLAAAAAAAIVVWMIVPRRPSVLPVDRAASGHLVPAEPAPPAAGAPREGRQEPALIDPIVAAKPAERADSARASGDLRQGDRLKNTGPASSRTETLDAAVSAPASPAIPLGGAAFGAQERSAASSTESASMARAASRAAAAPPVAAQQATSLDALRRQPVIVSSSSASRWRILPGGAVQHSTDGGSTWEVQSTGVAVTLAAGVSPSPSICWLVGPGGVVLLSTDGRSWQRRAFPEAADLASVSATDDKAATVTTSDGRTFSTNDGGRTWAQ